MTEPTLTVAFSWDNVAGIFWGTLPSGARFAVSRTDIGGKLEANLTLFRQAVTPVSDSRRISQAKEEIRKEISNLDLSQVQRFVGGKHVLDDLEINFDAD